MPAGIGSGGYCAPVRHWQLSTSFLAGHLPESRPSRRTRLRLQIAPPDHFQAGTRHQFGEIVQNDGSQEARSARPVRQARVWRQVVEVRGFGRSAVAQVVRPGGTTSGTSQCGCPLA